jgi:SET domain-containing protein
VGPSDIHGDGLFAARDIEAEQLIGVYQGPEVTEDGIYVLWIENEPGGDWTGYDGSNIMRFLNHSSQPNAEMDGLDCYALRAIPAGTEITIDYGWDDS